MIKVTGKNKFPTDWGVPCWNWDKFYGYTKDEIDATWESITADRLFWQKLDSIPEHEVFARLNTLSKTHDVYFITNRIGIDCKQQTERALYFNGINYPTVLIAADKLPLLKTLKIDFFCDDKLETMEATTPLGKEFFYLIEAPYNQEGRSTGLRTAANIKDALTKAGLWSA